MVAKKSVMKLGFEVEGRLKGVYTLFLSAEAAAEFFEFTSLKDRALPKGKADSVTKVQHIYISDHKNTLDYDADCLRRWADLGLLITLEVTSVFNRASYPRNVSFMLNVADGACSNTAFWELLPTDQIKFSRYLLTGHQVRCVTVESMTSTRPSDFHNDINFTASAAKQFRMNAILRDVQ